LEGGHRGKQNRQGSFFVQLDSDLLRSDFHNAGVGEEFVVECRGGLVFMAGEVLSEKPQEVMSQYRHSQVEVDFDDHRGANPVEVKELDLLGDLLLYEPALGIGAQDVLNGTVEVVDYGDSLLNMLILLRPWLFLGLGSPFLRLQSLACQLLKPFNPLVSSQGTPCCF
jgi:hypothetical protein